MTTGTNAPRFSSGRRAVAALLALLGLLTTVLVERRSEQRANRLYRAGQLPDAALIYGSRIDADSTVSRLRYNLGTTLLGLEIPAAVEELSAGATSQNDEVRTRSLYSLGLWSLRQALDAETTDTARAYAAISVESSKEALRLRPQREDTRWNLALAQRMLDSIDAQEGRAGDEAVDGMADADQLLLSDDLREMDDEDLLDNAPQQGEDEALAQSDELTPLSLQEANEILGSGHLDASTMIMKLLALEGRSLRQRRITTTGPRW